MSLACIAIGFVAQQPSKFLRLSAKSAGDALILFVPICFMIFNSNSQNY